MLAHENRIREKYSRFLRAQWEGSGFCVKTRQPNSTKFKYNNQKDVVIRIEEIKSKRYFLFHRYTSRIFF